MLWLTLAPLPTPPHCAEKRFCFHFPFLAFGSIFETFSSRLLGLALRLSRSCLSMPPGNHHHAGSWRLRRKPCVFFFLCVKPIRKIWKFSSKKSLFKERHVEASSEVEVCFFLLPIPVSTFPPRFSSSSCKHNTSNNMFSRCKRGQNMATGKSDDQFIQPDN